MKQIIKTGFGIFLLSILFFLSAAAQSTTPVIGDNPTKNCYNKLINLNIKPLNNTGLLYDWEYWRSGDYNYSYINSEYESFLTDICISLRAKYAEIFSEDPTALEGVNMDYVNYVVGNYYLTDYDFMIPFLDLYEDLSSNIGYIAFSLILGITDQNSGILHLEEIQFLYTYFPEAVMNQVSFPRPFGKLWTSMIENQTEAANVTCDPKVPFPAEITRNTKLAFRVRDNTTPGLHGTYSNIVILDILPVAPTFTVSYLPFCFGGETEIKVANIESNVPGNYYQYSIAKVGYESDHAWFTGTEKTMVSKYGAGTYSISLNFGDSVISGCYTERSLPLESYPELTYSLSSTPVTCYGLSDGSINVQATKTAGSYSVNVSSDNGYSKTENNISNCAFPNLPAGNYTVNVTDLCTTLTKPVTLTQPTEVTITCTPINPTCNSPSNGSFSIIALGGRNNIYDYYIKNSSGVTVVTATGQSSSWSYNSLPGGDYTINVRDNAHPNCAGATIVQHLNSGTSLNLFETSVRGVKCFGQNTGEIQVSASGGSNNYLFKIDNGNFTVNSTFNSLYAGDHNVYVRNSDLKCNDVRPLIVKVGTNSQINITLTPKDVTCFENGDGEITAAISGGVGNYKLLWEIKEDNEWQYKAQDKNSIDRLNPGDYRLKVEDSVHCQVTSVATVNQPDAPLQIANIIPQDIKCLGETGIIEIEATGGNGGYNYSFYEGGGTSYENKQQNFQLPAGNYKLKVTDIKGCEVTWNYDEEVPITEPAAILDFNYDLSDYNGYNISCNGDSNGSVALLASGGNGNKGGGGIYTGYTYMIAGRPFQSDPYITGISGNTYNVTVSDNRGCNVSKQVTFTEPPKLNLSLLAKDDIQCFGSTTGLISVVASGGVGKIYSYRNNSLDFVTASVFPNLIANSYAISVKDSNNCQQSLVVDINHIYEEIKANFVAQDVRCYAENNGLINSNVTGGSGSYDLLWEQKSINNWQYKQIDVTGIAALEPAYYRLSITDKIGCPAVTDSVIIDQPDAVLEVSLATLHDIRCYGETGSIEMQAAGGNGGYEYYYSRNAWPYQLFNSGSSLISGTYNLITRDIKGCEATWPDPVTITDPPGILNFSYALSDYNGFNISCYGNNNGKVTVSPVGGNGSNYHGYSYFLSGGPVQSDPVFTSLTSGNYNLTLNDARGCSVTRPVTLTQPAASLKLNVVSMTDTKCFNDSTGIIELTGSGGVQPFEYKVALKNFGTANVFDKLPAGDYNFAVRDINGCIQTIDTIIKSIYPKPVTTLVAQEIACYQKSDGAIQASLAGGSGSFGLKWFIESERLLQFIKSDTLKITSLAPGDYFLQITDKIGCPSFYDSTTVYQRVTPLVIDKVLLNDIKCFGDSGSIDMQASGSNGGYIYKYSKNNQSYENYLPGAPLPFASYKLMVKDSKGCETFWDEEEIITQPPNALDFAYAQKEFNGYNVSCFGNNDGEIFVKPSGGNGNIYSGYSYLLSGRNIQTDSLFTNLTARAYDISVTDGRGCMTSKSVILRQDESKIKLWATNLYQPTCYYDSTGRIELASSGGISPYLYRLDSEDYIIDNKFSNLKVNNYHFTVKDANGCLQYFDTSVVSTVSKMEISGILENVKCFGQNNGAINTTIAGGAKPFNYSWEGIASTDTGIKDLFKGVYTLLVTDNAGCRSERLFEIKEPSLPVSLTATSQSACDETPNGVIILRALGGTAPYFFGIDDPDNMLAETKFMVYGGNYEVYVADINNCRAESEVTVSVRNVKPSVNFMVATSRYALDTLVVKDVSLPRPDSVKWDFSPEASIIENNLLYSKIKYGVTGIYPVKMTGYFESCEYTVEKLLNIAPFDPQILPNEDNLSGIESVEISPNPNMGQFILKVKLYTKQQVHVKVIDLYSKLWYSKQYPADLEFEDTISITEALPGTYVLWVVTENDSKALLFIISR